MVRPSHPRLVARVLDAVVNLDDTKGSSSREVLNFIRQSNVPSRNLTMQVHRALKNAVNAGLLRRRSGRYKVLATLTPTPAPALPTKEPDDKDQKTEQKKVKPDVRMPAGDTESPRRTRDRKKRTTSRRRSSKRRSKRRKSRRSPYTTYRRANAENRKRRQRKRTYEDEEFEDQSSGRYVLHGRNESSVPFNRKTKRSRVSDRDLESDFSDESDRESDVNRKRVSQASTSVRREPKPKAINARSRDRSASRARSLQQGQVRHPIEEIGNDRQQRDGDHELVVHQEAHEDVEGTHEPNESNSGSTLENS